MIQSEKTNTSQLLNKVHQKELHQGVRQKHLSTKITLITSSILIVIFVIMIGSVVFLSSATTSAAISSEFDAMGKSTSKQIENILSVAENSANAITAYLQKRYEQSANQTSNSNTTQKYKSIVYSTEISEGSYDVEKYIIENIRQTVLSSNDVTGMGVLFEPYAFDTKIDNYSFYVSDATINDDVKPYLSYQEFSTQEYYQIPKESKETYVTAPYVDNGINMVTFCSPVLYNGEVKGVITADINVTNFEKIVNQDQKYPSKYTTILNQDGIVIYDTESLDNVGAKLSDFIVKQKDLSKITDGMNGTEAFDISIIREDGTSETSFYNPIQIGNTKWWAITALEDSDMNRSVSQLILILTIMAIVALIILIASLYITIKKMLLPINAVVDMAKSISDGNLNVHLNIESNDEIGLLVEAFDTTVSRLHSIIDDEINLLNNMAKGNFNLTSQAEEFYVGDFSRILSALYSIINQLSDTMGQINNSAEEVSNGSQQVSTGAQMLSQGATEQASSVEELAATISEISSQVNETAENAQIASKTAETVGSEMTESNHKMEQMIAAMHKITASSNEIARIIKTIEDIAFQTNILALNAAVEAARAGDAGKGFAVVADEVRNLASKSAEASKNTAELIESSVKAVSEGTQIVDETAQSLILAVNDANKVVQIVNTISTASQEQASSITQIMQGMDQISSVVQTNSATAEESAAASEELSEQAHVLKDLVARFEIREQV